ncbi:MAG: redoxin domain-containing protein, partial [Methanothrix sp.]|nr:redoxin domain-containing protein [Methanothrix sp.]
MFMSIKCKESLISGLLTLFVILSSLLFVCSSTGLSQEAKAPDFQAVDLDGKNISLGDFRGEVVLLHITNIENPLCRECEHALNAQTS